MGYRNLRECLDDLERTGQLVRVDHEVDGELEVAEIQRRVYAVGGPAIYYPRVKDCRFPLGSNLFGTIERTRFLFRDTIESVKRLVELKGDPGAALRSPLKSLGLLGTAWSMRPKHVRRGPVTECTARVSDLPAVRNWPDDGGPFITLPQVYTEDPRRPGWRHSNLGMYRVQLSGGQYQPDQEVGLHYQIHRSIGIHHAAAIERGEPLRVAVAVGGPPTMPLSAVMPLPEGLPELAFAGALGGRRVRLVRSSHHLPVPAEADFCLVGTIDPERLLPEGPFGDHLGYYSLAHDFPVMRVEQVYHRRDAVWPFTVVGRPPQEDTSFGEIIHELTGPAIPTVVPGVHAVHAVDAAGVHPLLLAIGSERYVPYAEKRQPMELLTCANAILGQGQLSLAKYLVIAAREDNPDLDIHDIVSVFRHVLERIDPSRDLHFQTSTTIDTLDYTGTGLNQGSKLVLAAAGCDIESVAVQRSIPSIYEHGSDVWTLKFKQRGDSPVSYATIHNTIGFGGNASMRSNFSKAGYEQVLPWGGTEETRMQYCFIPPLLAFQRIIEGRGMEQSYEHIIAKTAIFLAGFKSHLELGGQEALLDELDDDFYVASDPHPLTYPAAMFA